MIKLIDCNTLEYDGGGKYEDTNMTLYGNVYKISHTHHVHSGRLDQLLPFSSCLHEHCA